MGIEQNNILVIDAGNSRIKAGIFNRRELRSLLNFGYEELTKLSKLVAEYSPSDALLICTSGREAALMEILRNEELTPFYWSQYSDFKLPFQSEYSTPETIGKDRLAGMAGAQRMFQGSDLLVICMGTCITYDLLIDGVHKGGAISPGTGMRFKSMNAFTGHLPLVHLSYIDRAFPGKTTSDSLTIGVVTGVIAEIESVILSAKQYSEKINVILTGGDNEWFAPKLKSPIFAIPNLTLTGLNEILLFQK